MTTLDRIKVKCSNCGKIQEKIIVMSTNSMGPGDFDLRPAPMMRNTLKYRVQFCENCGYGAHNIENMDDVTKEIVNSKEYQEFIHSFVDSTTLMGYLGSYYVNLKKQYYRKAFYDILSASWVLDDLHSPLNVKTRLLGIKIFIDCEEKGFSLDDKAVVVDMLRRSGKFVEAITLAKSMLENEKLEKIIIDVLDYQIRFCNNKDTKCHSLGEIK